MQQTIRNLAVLIDADNVSAAHAGFIFATARKLGDPLVRRAYGMVNCFSQEKGWWNAQREYGIVARPQVSNVSGKNVADIALVIDAMEHLYKKTCDAFCIVSSDSDFTALAAKIREEGVPSTASAARRHRRASVRRVPSSSCCRADRRKRRSPRRTSFARRRVRAAAASWLPDIRSLVIRVGRARRAADFLSNSRRSRWLSPRRV